MGTHPPTNPCRPIMIFFRRSHVYDPVWEITPQIRWLMWTSGWRGVLVLITLSLGSVLSWKGAEIYEGVKIWRAERLIAQSELARANRDMHGASSALRQAAILLQRHPLVLRAVARHQIEIHDLAALDTYTALLKTGEATTEDKLAFGRQAFRLGRPELATSVLEELNDLPDLKDTSVMLALKAEQSAAEGHWPEALKLARQASTAPGSDADKANAQSLLARLLLQPSPQQRDTQALLGEGVALLNALALRPDAAGLEALELLVTLSQNPQIAPLFVDQGVTPLMTAARHHPRAETTLKVNIWSLRLAAEPTKRESIAQAFFDHFKSDPSPTVRLEAARWLNQKGMHPLVLALAEPSKLESKDWFVLYLDATAALGHWEEVLRALNAKDHEIPLAPTLRKLFEFRGLLEAGRKPDIADSWHDIQVASRTASTSDQLYVAGYAEQSGFPTEAARVYERLLHRNEGLLSPEDKLSRPRLLACYTGLLRTGAGAKTLRDLAKLMKAFATEFPEIDEVQNDSAYLQLLIGEDLDKAESTAQKLVQKKPELLAYRTTLALSALKRQKTAEAAAIYKDWSIDWSTAPDRYKAVYAAMMRAAGRPVEADQVAATIKAENLRPEERQLAGLP